MRVALVTSTTRTNSSMPAHRVVNIDGPNLTDAVGTVLRLPMVGWHPIKVVKDDLSGCRQVDADSACLDIGRKDPDFRVLLEPVNQRPSFAGQGLASQLNR